MNLGCSLLINN